MLYNIRKIVRSSSRGLQVLVHDLFILHLDYCNSLPVGLPACAIRTLAHPECSSPAGLQATQVLPQYTNPLHPAVAAPYRIQSVVLAYLAGNGSGPSYIQDMVKPYTHVCPQHSMPNAFHLPHYKGPSCRSTKP